jgi:ketosteroid isomerase-like protein
MRPAVLASLTGAMTLLVACGPQEAGFTNADAAQIRADVDRYVELTLAGDFAGVAQMFTSGGVVMPPNAEAVESRVDIQAFLEAFPTITTFTSTAVYVGGSGDFAYARGTYSLLMTVEGADTPTPDRGKWMVVYERQADGSWLAASEIWNSDLALPQ